MREVRTKMTDKDFLAKLRETKKTLEGKIKKNVSKVEFISSSLVTLFIIGFILMVIGLSLKSELGLLISAIGLFLNFLIPFLHFTVFKKYPEQLRIIKLREKYGLPVIVEGDYK